LSFYTQLNEPPTKVSGLQGEKAESLFVSPILENTVSYVSICIDNVTGSLYSYVDVT